MSRGPVNKTVNEIVQGVLSYHVTEYVCVKYVTNVKCSIMWQKSIVGNMTTGPIDVRILSHDSWICDTALSHDIILLCDTCQVSYHVSEVLSLTCDMWQNKTIRWHVMHLMWHDHFMKHTPCVLIAPKGVLSHKYHVTCQKVKWKVLWQVWKS